MQENREQSGDVVCDMLVIGLFLIACAVAAAFARESRVMQPSLGDIIVFETGTQQPGAPDTDIQALVADSGGAAQPDKTCSLRVGTMKAVGGSLVVEAFEPQRGPAYRVHWAGGPTNSGPSDCGTDADLFLAPDAFSALQAATTGVASPGILPSIASLDSCGQGPCRDVKTRDHVLDLTTILLDGTV